MTVFQIKSTGKMIGLERIGFLVDNESITITIDFLSIYTDRKYHGKEEDILFKTLSKTKRSEELTKTMNQLLKDQKPHERPKDIMLLLPKYKMVSFNSSNYILNLSKPKIHNFSSKKRIISPLRNLMQCFKNFLTMIKT